MVDRSRRGEPTTVVVGTWGYLAVRFGCGQMEISSNILFTDCLRSTNTTATFISHGPATVIRPYVLNELVKWSILRRNPCLRFFSVIKRIYFLENQRINNEDEAIFDSWSSILFVVKKWCRPENVVPVKLFDLKRPILQKGPLREIVGH